MGDAPGRHGPQPVPDLGGTVRPYTFLGCQVMSAEFSCDTGSPLTASFEIEARVRTEARTGAEMEALHAVAVAALTVYDMVKAADKTMTITDIRLVKKTGGKSGAYIRR